MSRFLLPVVGLLGLGGLVLAVLVLQPGPQLLPYFEGCMSEWMSPPVSKERQEELDRITDELYHRRKAKWQMAKEVIAGRLSLADALARFHALDEGKWPDRLLTLEGLEISEEEWDGQGVIFYVRLVLKSGPGKEDPVVGRLEKELQELLASRRKRPPAPGVPQTEERSR